MKMVGYRGAGYILCDPRNKEYIISRNVRFDEMNYKPKKEKQAENHFSGMKIDREQKILKITQTYCIQKLLKLFKMDECKAVATSMKANYQINIEENRINVLIASLMYLSLTSRPNINFEISHLSRWE